MHCFNHPQEAIGICFSCARGLCLDCKSSNYNALICSDNTLCHEHFEKNQQQHDLATKQLLRANSSLAVMPWFCLLLGSIFIYFGLSIQEDGMTTYTHFFTLMGSVFAANGLIDLYATYRNRNTKKPIDKNLQ